MHHHYNAAIGSVNRVVSLNAVSHLVFYLLFFEQQLELFKLILQVSQVNCVCCLLHSSSSLLVLDGLLL